MNPAALTIEALPAIVIFSAFVLVMIKIFIINAFPTKQEREQRYTERRNEKDMGKCTAQSHQ